jgi:ABC-type sugar transport system permease subunit
MQADLGTLPVSRRRGLPGRVWRARNAYVFIAPFYLSFLVFGLGPILFGFYLSTVSWSGFDQMRFVGVHNFQLLFADDLFWTSLTNTIYLWLGHIFIMLALALLLALLLNAPWLRLRSVFRTIVYLPNVGATAAVALVFAMIFDTTYGILNRLLALVGLPAVNWLGSADWSKPSIIILNVWNITGWYMLILLAGLQTIDPVLYEAAAIDGAGGIGKLRHVTLPGLRRILFFCFIIETIGSLQIFTEPLVLTGGGPDNSSLTLALYLYQNGFTDLRLGYAAAISVVLFALTVVLSLTQALVFRGGAFSE